MIPPPRFDLIIFDEAHHLRNPGTKSFELARFLCDVSKAVLFLSATPVHVGSKNLFALLNLTRPDLFPDLNVFREMIEPNRHIFDAMRYVRQTRPEDMWQQKAAQAMADAARTGWGNNVLEFDPRFASWKERLENNNLVTSQDRVRCLRELEEVHTLAHVLKSNTPA